jgi:hypothetical protein
MNSQSYAGRSNWTVDEILPTLTNYTGWGSYYGVSSTSQYNNPSSAETSYYYAKTSLSNASNTFGKNTWTWLETQKAISDYYGEGNFLAHWLHAGYREGLQYPTSDATAYKTSQYYKSKWDKMGGSGSGYTTPLDLAYFIESYLGMSKSNSASILESAAKQHYDKYGASEGLIRPYAAGGVAGAGSWGLVGEVGPELVRFGSSTAISPTSVSRNILGDAFSDLTAEVKSMKQQLYAAMRETAKNTQKLAKLADTWDTEGLAVKEATA